jgi:ABC-type nitrate/sulfonate/bicarbonate transport system substrate-binding protein
LGIGKRIPKALAVRGAALSAMLLLAACGGAAAPANRAPAKTTAAKAAPAAQQPAAGTSGGPSGPAQGSSGKLRKVTLGLTSYNSLHLWVIVAKDEGLMKPYGIDFVPETFQSVAEIVPGVLSGSLDFGLATVEGAFAAQNKDRTLRIVGAEVAKNPYTLVTSPKITSPEQLKGGTIAVDAIGVSADYVTALGLLHHYGLKPNVDYHFINGGAPATRVAAMVNGEVQGTLDFPPATQVLERKGMKPLIEAGTLPQFQNIVLASLLSDTKWYRTHRSLAVDFVKGYLASVRWLYDPANKSRVIADIAKTEKASAADAAATYRYFVQQLQAQSKTGLVTTQALENEIGNDRAAGIKNLPAAGDLSWRFDDSLVKAAQGGA